MAHATLETDATMTAPARADAVRYVLAVAHSPIRPPFQPPLQPVKRGAFFRPRPDEKTGTQETGTHDNDEKGCRLRHGATIAIQAFCKALWKTCVGIGAARPHLPVKSLTGVNPLFARRWQASPVPFTLPLRAL